MSEPHPISPDVLKQARAYVRVDQARQALPVLEDAIRAFEPMPGPAGESVAKWLAKHAFHEPQEATVRLRLSYGKVTGVYALCTAQIVLDTIERAQLGGVRYRTQPAIRGLRIRRGKASAWPSVRRLRFFSDGLSPTAA